MGVGKRLGALYCRLLPGDATRHDPRDGRAPSPSLVRRASPRGTNRRGHRFHLGIRRHFVWSRRERHWYLHGEYTSAGDKCRAGIYPTHPGSGAGTVGATAGGGDYSGNGDRHAGHGLLRPRGSLAGTERGSKGRCSSGDGRHRPPVLGGPVDLCRGRPALRRLQRGL